MGIQEISQTMKLEIVEDIFGILFIVMLIICFLCFDSCLAKIILAIVYGADFGDHWLPNFLILEETYKWFLRKL